MPWESNRGSQEQDTRSPPNYATYATSLIHVTNLWICELYVHLTLVNFTTVQMNETEPTRSNPAVFPKIRNICYVVVAISIMEIATTT